MSGKTNTNFNLLKSANDHQFLTFSKSTKWQSIFHLPKVSRMTMGDFRSLLFKGHHVIFISLIRSLGETY